MIRALVIALWISNGAAHFAPGSWQARVYYGWVVPMERRCLGVES